MKTFLGTGDFNHDGFIDILLGGPKHGRRQLNHRISILLSNGDGTFQPPVYYSFPNGVTEVVVADFNGDGNPDLAVAANSSILVMLGSDDGTFKAGIRTAVSANRRTQPPATSRCC